MNKASTISGRCMVHASAEERLIAKVNPPRSEPMNEQLLRESFKVAAEPLIRWLNNHPEHLHPHHTVIVTPTSAELLEGSMSHRTVEFLRD